MSIQEELPAFVKQIAKQITNFDEMYGKICSFSDCLSSRDPGFQELYKKAISDGLVSVDQQAIAICTDRENFGLIILNERHYYAEEYKFRQPINVLMCVTDSGEIPPLLFHTSDEQPLPFFHTMETLEIITQISPETECIEQFIAHVNFDIKLDMKMEQTYQQFSDTVSSVLFYLGFFASFLTWLFV